MINCKKLRFYNRFTVDFTVVGGQIGCPYFTVFFLKIHSVEWLPQRAAASGKTGKLCIESHTSVFILVIFAVIAAFIGHSKLLITQPSRERFHVANVFIYLRHVNAFTCLR